MGLLQRNVLMGPSPDSDYPGPLLSAFHRYIPHDRPVLLEFLATGCAQVEESLLSGIREHAVAYYHIVGGFIASKTFDFSL